MEGAIVFRCHTYSHKCVLFIHGLVCAQVVIWTGNLTFWFFTILLLTYTTLEISWNQYFGRQHLLIAVNCCAECVHTRASYWVYLTFCYYVLWSAAIFY